MDRTVLSQIVTGKLPYENINKDNVIVVIGSSESGPPMIPIEAESYDTVVQIFGYGSQFANAYAEFSQIGVGNVYMIKTNGVPSEAVIQSSGVDKLTLTSINTTLECNYINYQIETYNDDRYLDITDSNGITSTYSLNDKTITEIADEINRDAYMSLIPVYAVAHSNESTDILADCLATTLTGADPKLIRPSEYDYEKIEEVLNNLLGIRVFQVALLDCNVLTYVLGKGYLYSALSEFADNKASMSEPCIITAGCNVYYTDSALLQDLFDFGKPMGNVTNYEYSPNEYINIVVAKISVDNLPAEYISNGVMSYSALISTADGSRSLTNSIVYKARENLLEFDIDGYTNDEIVKMISDMGFVTFIKDGSNNVRVYRSTNMLYGTGGTYFINNVEYTKPYSMCYLVNALLIQRISMDMSDALEKYIGSTTVTEDEIEQSVKEVMANYSSSVRNYSVEISRRDNYRQVEVDSLSMLPQDFTKDHEVRLDIVPYGEVDSIGFAVSL